MALGANVELANSFNDWRVRTNEILDEMKTVVVRAGNTATGNATIVGYLTVNGAFVHANSTAGISLKVSTDAVLSVRNRTDAAYGSVLALNINATGNVVATGNVSANSITATGNLTVNATGSVAFSGRARITSTADGKIQVANNAGTAGTIIDVSSDGQISIRNRADTDYATFYASDVVSSTALFPTGNTRTKITSSADGSLTLSNTAGTGFGSLVFGVANTSFPALKRSATQLQVRLGDDSGYSELRANSLVLNSGSSIIDVSDGLFRFANTGLSGFTGFILGTNNSSGLRLKKNSTTLEVRTGNDGGWATVTADKVKLVSGLELPTGVPGTTTDRLYNDGGSLKFNGSPIGGTSPYSTMSHIVYLESQFTPKALDGALIQGTSTTAYTAPTSTWALVRNIHLCSSNATANITPTIRLVPTSTTPGDQHNIFCGPLMPYEAVVLPGPMILEAGDTIRHLATTGNQVSIRAEVIEFTTQPNGVTLKPIDSVALSGSSGWQTIYTCPTSTIAVLDWLNLTNYHATTNMNNLAVAVVPSGMATNNNAHVIFRAYDLLGNALRAGETATLSQMNLPIVLEAGDFVTIYSDTASVATAAGSVREYSV